nr:hypothetical protein [Tanacetum cinerariifolium]
MLEIVPVSEFKVEALQVKYPIIDWEVHSEGSRTYWKTIRVGGITEAYHSFKDMLKGFNREDLVALWNLMKEKFSSAVLSVDKEKALWVEQKILFEPDANDKGVNAAEPTVFDDEEVTMTMAQTMIKIKAKKAKLLDDQIAQKLHDKEVQKATARDKQEKDDLERGMTYDKVRPIFEREYKKVQTLLNPDKDVEEPKKKRVADETLLQESFKKLKAVEVSDADDVLWKLQRYMHYPITWKLYTNCEVYQVSSTTRRHDMFMLTEKDYPLSNGVMILMLSAKLQVEEDNEMARDLVMKIFMEANKPKSKNLNKIHQGDNAAGLSITTAGLRLMLLGKVDTADEVIEEFTLSR